MFDQHGGVVEMGCIYTEITLEWMQKPSKKSPAFPT